jgi:hypothetical protein
MRSGWEKRMCTLQICVFADGVIRIKPLLIYKGAGGKKSKALINEYKRYDPRVIVIFNPKAYANTQVLIDWVKNQYSTASAYPLRDQEPRLLSLDSFAPQKNKGTKVPEKETLAAREKRLKKRELLRQLKEEFAKLKVTLLVISSGTTSYLQVLNLLANGLIKGYISNLE